MIFINLSTKEKLKVTWDVLYIKVTDKLVEDIFIYQNKLNIFSSLQYASFHLSKRCLFNVDGSFSEVRN